MAAHTPGPWWVIPDPTGQTILCDVGGPTCGNTTVAEDCYPADARLIAVAPDLRAFAQKIALRDPATLPLTAEQMHALLFDLAREAQQLVAKADGAQ